MWWFMVIVVFRLCVSLRGDFGGMMGFLWLKVLII